MRSGLVAEYGERNTNILFFFYWNTTSKITKLSTVITKMEMVFYYKKEVDILLLFNTKLYPLIVFWK